MTGASFLEVVFLAFVLMQFVQALVKPLIEVVNLLLRGEPVKEMVLSLWPLYVTVAVAATLAWSAEYNLLPMLGSQLLGRILTAIGIGLGPSFLYDTFQDT